MPVKPPHDPQAEKSGHASYDAAWFEPLMAAEDRHFWFRARNIILSRVISQITRQLDPGYRVLEVGCGTGNVLRVLEQACPGGTVVGMDLFAEGLAYAQQRVSCLLVQGDMHQPPFGVPFDVIGLFDVLEHLPDDHKVLRDLFDMLAPGGRLLLTVPAHQALWSYFDEAAHHCRRYELPDLQDRLTGAGYAVEYLTPYMAALYPLLRLWRGRRPAANESAQDRSVDELRIVPVLNDVLAFALAQEARLIARRRRLPFGSSLLAVARRL
ncbi:MAG: class I SAM-dependent methyltransferase [Anaerolineae bacterium]|nr:class I SAM-dependent methyltransferase [Anaerolineae bacterium]